MMFPLWPPVAIIALLMMLTIMIILIYGDRICARVKTHTDRIAVRVPRPNLEPMMRMGSSERGGRHPQQQQQQRPPPQQLQQQAYLEQHQQQIPQRYSPPEPQQHQQEYQQRYEAPMELQKQSTTYGHRECEV